MRSKPKREATACSPALLSRFMVELLAPEWNDHTKVPFTVFRKRDLSDAEYSALLAPLDSDDRGLRCAVNETFTAAEVELLRQFFAEAVPTWEFSTSPARPIPENYVGCGALAVGGSLGFAYWSESEDKLEPKPLPIMACYDLLQAESGPHVNGTWRGIPLEINGRTWRLV